MWLVRRGLHLDIGKGLLTGRSSDGLEAGAACPIAQFAVGWRLGDLMWGLRRKCVKGCMVCSGEPLEGSSLEGCHREQAVS